MHESDIGDTCMSGPFRGYHVTAFAAPAAGTRSRFDAYYKLCLAEPDSYWSADAIYKGRAPAAAATAVDALEEAIMAARRKIRDLPHADSYLPYRAEVLSRAIRRTPPAR